MDIIFTKAQLAVAELHFSTCMILLEAFMCSYEIVNTRDSR